MSEKLLLSVAGDRQTVLKSNLVIFRCFTLKINQVKCISVAHVVNKSFSTGKHFDYQKKLFMRNRSRKEVATLDSGCH